MSHLRGRINAEFQLGLLAIVNRKSLHEQGSESGSSASTEWVEDEESLETCALICQLSDAVQDQVYNLLAHSVVTSGIIVGSILLTSHQLLRVEQLSVGASSDLVNNSGLQVNKHGSKRNIMFKKLH